MTEPPRNIIALMFFANDFVQILVPMLASMLPAVHMYEKVRCDLKKG